MNAFFTWFKSQPDVPITGRHAMPPASIGWKPVVRLTLVVGFVSTLCVFIARGSALVAPALGTRALLVLAAALAVAGVVKWATRGATKDTFTTTLVGIAGLALVTGNQGPLNFLSLAITIFVCWFIVALVVGTGADEKIDRLPVSTVFLLAGIALVSLALAQPGRSLQFVLWTTFIAIVANCAFALCMAHVYANYLLAHPDQGSLMLSLGRTERERGVPEAVGAILALLVTAAGWLWAIHKLDAEATAEPGGAACGLQGFLSVALVVVPLMGAGIGGRTTWRMLSVWLLYDGEPRAMIYRPFVGSASARRAIFGCVMFASVVPIRVALAQADVNVLTNFGFVVRQAIENPVSPHVGTLLQYLISFLLPAAMLPTAVAVFRSPVRRIETAVPTRLPFGHEEGRP